MVAKSRQLGNKKNDGVSNEEEIKKQIAELQGKLQVIQVESNDDMGENLKIAQDEYIKIISLCPVPLNLSTEGMGRGKVFKFSKFGDKKNILYSDLNNIIENQSHFVNSGFFYIMDKRVIRKHGLDEVYTQILSKEQIEKIINGDEKEAVDLFVSANPKQQEFICEFLVTKLRDGAELDLNLVDRISRAAKVDIAKKAEEAKAYSEIKE